MSVAVILKDQARCASQWPKQPRKQPLAASRGLSLCANKRPAVSSDGPFAYLADAFQNGT